MSGIIVLQFVFADFAVTFIPQWPSWLPGKLIFLYGIGGILIAGYVAILRNNRSRFLATIIAIIFLALILISGIPFTLNHYPAHLGSWTNVLKTLAYVGGFLVLAGSFPADNHKTYFILKLIPAGRYLFAAMITAFGISHFLYVEFVKELVPAWIPWHVFWTYLCGIALIASGISIFINVKIRLAANLLGLMFFSWFIILHIPRAIADPFSGNGNEIKGVFEVLAFSMTSFLIGSTKPKNAIH